MDLLMMEMMMRSVRIMVSTVMLLSPVTALAQSGSAKIKSVDKFTDVTLRRGVVPDNGLSQWQAGVAKGSQRGNSNDPQRGITKVNGLNKSTDVTLKRGVVPDNSLFGWHSGVSQPTHGANTVARKPF
jgi:hypothetical protein